MSTVPRAPGGLRSWMELSESASKPNVHACGPPPNPTRGPLWLVGIGCCARPTGSLWAAVGTWAVVKVGALCRFADVGLWTGSRIVVGACTDFRRLGDGLAGADPARDGALSGPKKKHGVRTVAPKVICVAFVKPVPVTNTAAPPPVGPLLGATTVTDGTGVGVYVYWSAVEAALVPPGVVTRMSTGGPTDPAGLVTSIRLSSIAPKPPKPDWVACADPNDTPVRPDSPLPVMKTSVPPPDGPLAGAT